MSLSKMQPNTLQKCTRRALEAQINEVSCLQEASLSSDAINTEVGTLVLYLPIAAVQHMTARSSTLTLEMHSGIF